MLSGYPHPLFREAGKQSGYPYPLFRQAGTQSGYPYPLFSEAGMENILYRVFAAWGISKKAVTPTRFLGKRVPKAGTPTRFLVKRVPSTLSIPAFQRK